ncbi:MAG: GNAT family N-acetyltransferase [Chitinophagaceae bacterium]|nr:MAG: GNAT family N-acetyltransferase [Chitinophagaceae bacterium]
MHDGTTARRHDGPWGDRTTGRWSCEKRKRGCISSLCRRAVVPRGPEALVAEHNDNLFVAEYGGNLLGGAELLWNRTCPVGQEAGAELSKLYILEHFCGRRVGRGLLEIVQDKVRERGGTGLWLEVWVENLRAIAFYKHRGFVDIGQNDFQMEVNRYENRVMRKELPREL